MAKSSMGSMKPLADRVVVKPVDKKEEKSASGIIIPDSANKDRPAQGTVIAVGPGRFSNDGKRIPMEVKVGQLVYFKKPWDEPIKFDGEEFYVLSESDITLIVN